jgi:hypothetical protein
VGLTKWGFGLLLDWSKSAPPPDRPTARPSQFADWVYRNSLPRRSFGSASEYPDFCKRLDKGVLDHALIDRSIQATWVQKHIGSSTPSDWIKEYIDGFYEDPKPLLASNLLVGEVPLRGKPDVVLRNRHDRTVLIIERKTTRLQDQDIPEDGWANVEAQLWCYSWIDEYLDAPEVLLLGQLWRNRQLVQKHFLWRRNDHSHDLRCRTWFERYGGSVILNHAIGEIFLLGITTHILKWQYRDRGLIRQGERRPFPWRAPANRYAIDAHRTRDVLELLHAHILEVDGELVAHLLIEVRDADAAGLRYTF